MDNVDHDDGVIEDDMDIEDDNCDNNNIKWSSCSDVIDCDDDVDVWLWRLWYLLFLMYEW